MTTPAVAAAVAEELETRAEIYLRASEQCDCPQSAHRKTVGDALAELAAEQRAKTAASKEPTHA